MDLTTGAGGITGPEELPEGTSYQVQITDPRFSLWQPAGDLDVSTPAAEAAAAVVRVPARGRDAAAEDEAVEEAAEEALAEAAAAASAPPLLDVTLVPQAGRRLVVVRRVTDDGQPVTAGMVTIRSAGSGFSEPFSSFADGNVYAVAPIEAITVDLASPELREQMLCPQAFQVPYTVTPAAEIRPLEFIHWPAIQIVAKPVIDDPDTGKLPLYGTTAQVQYQGAGGDVVSCTKTLEQNPNDHSGELWFEYCFSGEYSITVTPPDMFQGLPVRPAERSAKVPLQGPFKYEMPADFEIVPTHSLTIQVQPPPGKQLTGPAEFDIHNGATSVTVSVDPKELETTARVPKDIPLKIRLAAGAALTVAGDSPRIGAVPVQMSAPDQPVVPGPNMIELEYEHSLTIDAMDEAGRPVPAGMVDVYYEQDPNPVATITVNQRGSFLLGLADGGTYYLAEHLVAGQVQQRERVPVHSGVRAKVTMYGAHRGNGGGGAAVTDLSAYPVLTEEVSTIGPPAPAGGAPGPGGPGAGYGQTVDQAMRDVLGWRPSGDVAGFQAALTGAFQLKAVEGHTEWTWQQRGYAVQADMGALTGAQASIYARAKAALDQIQPLLAGITALNPTLYPPQDLEAIRTVIAAELQELVSELAWPAGPRIQRVNELFTLLVGESRKSFDPNPDHVQGQLGTMRDRFGLTVDWVDTVEEEFILTNFRVVVEQVLSLQESWFYDRKLLSKLDVDTSFGTILIWLSRGLEAVCESVDDLTFAMDSVYVDAAQRQVIELKLSGQSPMLLSDLLDWIVRAGREEGPRIIQDAGKDGVLAFAPVLRNLRELVKATRALVRGPHGAALPDGLRTPRVDRAFQVLAAQLDEATRLAGLVRRLDAAQIDYAVAAPPDPDGIVTVTITGTNFRKRPTAVLIAENREDLPELRSYGNATFTNPSNVTAHFRDPAKVPNSRGVTWQVMLINEDGQRTNKAAI